jgi:hypothetical protein
MNNFQQIFVVEQPNSECYRAFYVRDAQYIDAKHHSVHGRSQLGIETICTWTSSFVTNENTANTDALKEIERLRALAKLNEDFKYCNF